MLEGNILITGGTGTLGYALCRQAARDNWPCNFTIMSRSELNLARMRAKFPQYAYMLGDIRSADVMQLATARQTGVIHAAAMKRIPECEERPDECIWTNVFGSLNVLRASMTSGCGWVLGISTDKACSAITAYGASKLMMEAAFNAQSTHVGTTRPLLVRYGNVVASNGSVVPLWRKAYEEGRPLGITHKDMTRFWMSPTDAVNLIDYVVTNRYNTIRATVVPEVGSMSLATLAQGLFPGCELREIGLRSNEKIHEDLVAPTEFSKYADGKYFVTSAHTVAGWASLGTSFTSQSARRLSIEEFRAMLDDAEDLERLMQ